MRQGVEAGGRKLRQAARTWGAPRGAGLTPVQFLHQVRTIGRLRLCRHACWIIDYVSNSAERYRVEAPGTPWRVKEAHTLRLYAPNTAYWEAPPDDGDLRSEILCLKFLGGEIVGLDALLHPRLRYAHFLDPENIAGRLIEQIVRIGIEEGKQGFCRAQSALWLLIDRLLESEAVDAETRRITTEEWSPGTASLAESVDAYLSQHISEAVRLPTIACELGVSVSLLSHRYTAQTGHTPYARLLAMRIQRARSMIAAGTPLKAIARESGFSSASHFCRVFKRVEGRSPGDFLRQIRDVAGAQRG